MKCTLKAGGSSKINGLIEEYVVASGGNVNAGDFVKFMNDHTEKTDETSLKTTDYNMNMQALALNENRAIVYIRDTILICSIENNVITILKEFKPNLGTIISIILLESNRIFLTYASTSNYLYGTICTINDTVITLGTNVQLSNRTISVTYGRTKVVKTDINKIFISFGTTYDGVYGMICTINGTTITAGTDIKLIAATTYYYSVTTLGSNKIFISHAMKGTGDSTERLYAMICTIDDTIITVGTDVNLQGEVTYQCRCNECVSYKENKVFVTYHVGGSSHLYGEICTINDTAITVESNIRLTNELDYDEYYSVLSIYDNFVLIATGKRYVELDNKGLLCSVICELNDTTITVVKEMTLKTSSYAYRSGTTSFRISPVLLAKNKTLINYYYQLYSGSSYYLSSTILDTYAHVTKKINNKEDKILGIAKSRGTSGQTVKVVVPQYENIESEMN